VQVNGEGTGDGAVALPVVDTAALGSNGPPDAAGTFFDISVSSCVSPTTRVLAYFEAGPTVDPLTHALISSGTSNVGVKIYEASEATVVGAQVSPGVTTAAQALTDSGTWHFYAGYSSETDEPRAGTVITSITYSLVYR
jgi:major type 1 subunit fimbrin (pilin)